MKRILSFAMIICSMFSLAGCQRAQTVAQAYNISGVTKIQFVEAMGNPAYGADTKIITDDAEIKEFESAIEKATIGKKIKESDLGVAEASSCYFYRDDEVVSILTFNGNDTTALFCEDGFYRLKYESESKTIFDLYNESEATIFVVDDNLNEMVRPEE